MLYELQAFLWGGAMGTACYCLGYLVGRYAAVRDIWDRP